MDDLTGSHSTTCALTSQTASKKTRSIPLNPWQEFVFFGEGGTYLGGGGVGGGEGQ
jgi:hypothetical protein